MQINGENIEVLLKEANSVVLAELHGLTTVLPVSGVQAEL